MRRGKQLEESLVPHSTTGLTNGGIRETKRWEFMDLSSMETMAGGV